MSARKTLVATSFIALLGGVALGAWLSPMTMDHGSNPDDSPASGNGGENDILYWVAPMDPGYRRDKPGKSPMGMDLVPVYAGSGSNSDALRIRPEVLNAIGARYAPVKRQSLRPVFTAPAIVRPNADRVAHIHVRTEGWVEKLHANAEGNRVQASDLLFDIYSPALVSAQEEYLQAVASDRAALARAGEERLRALGMLPAQIRALRETGRVQPLYQQRAPQDGVILELNIRQGMYVQPGTTIMSLVDDSSVWLEASLFPSQLDQVSVGDRLTFRTPGSSGAAPRPARVDYLYPTIDEATRTARVRAAVDNAERSLRPGEFVQADFRGPERTNVLAVPNAAVIRSRGSTRVILHLGEGRFRPAEVSTGLVTASHTEITSGLDEGEDVVVSAQFLIDSEASLEPALSRMSHSEHEAQESRHDHGGHTATADDTDDEDTPNHENHENHEQHEVPTEPDPRDTSPPAAEARADPAHQHHHPGASQ